MTDISTVAEEPSSLNTYCTFIETNAPVSPHHQLTPPSSSTQTSSPTITNQKFPFFLLLPVEIRLRIWAFAANATPRNLDIWTDFIQCREGDTIFYTQRYSCYLADKSPHPVLQATHESREEGLKHFTLEYKTVFPHPDINWVNPARFYVNYAADTLIPRGYWNICAFVDFKCRNWGRLRSLAVDVMGSFWKENVKGCISADVWAFEGIEEVIFYDAKSANEALFGPRDHYNQFKHRWDMKRRELRFAEMEEGGGELDVASKLFEGYFRKMNSEEAEVEETTMAVGGGVVDCEKAAGKSDLGSTDDDGADQVPRIRIMKLMVDIPGVAKITDEGFEPDHVSIGSFDSSADHLEARIRESMGTAPRPSELS